MLMCNFVYKLMSAADFHPLSMIIFKVCLNFHTKPSRYHFRCDICKQNHNILLHEDKAQAPVTLLSNTSGTQVLLQNEEPDVVGFPPSPASNNVFGYVVAGNLPCIGNVPPSTQFEGYALNQRDWPRDDRHHLNKVFRSVTHCFFDMDGTIIDTELTYHRMIRKICEGYGHKYTKEIQESVYGGTDKDVCLKVVEKVNLPITALELEKILEEQGKKYLADAPLQKGVERLLYHLHNHRIPFALATNSTAEVVRLHEMAKPKLFSMFHHKVCASDPELLRGKPQPDIYLLAMSRFNEPNLKPRNCLVFEDSLTGVCAGRDAGMQVVMIPQKSANPEMYRNATLVIRSLQEFRPEQFGLPPFEDKHARKINAMWRP